MIKKHPVILHTDIGSDIDDSWALLMLLRQPQWDIKMILCDTGDVRYRGALAAASLKGFGSEGIPIALGVNDESTKPMAGLLSGRELEEYNGPVWENGAEKLVEIVRASAEPVTLVSIGPAPAIAAALDMAPEIAGKIRFAGMFGSFRIGYFGEPTPSREYNVIHDIPAAQKIFSAKWLEFILTPLDTCGIVTLEGERFIKLKNSGNSRTSFLLDHYDGWRAGGNSEYPENTSSVLYDTVAVHLASSFEYLEMANVRLAVNDDGYTVEDPAAQECKVAVSWKDLEAYKDFLTDTLLS